MNAFTLTGWENFFVASAGASSALAGLLFVALSINLTRILALPGKAAQAGEALIPLAVVLAVSLLALVPGQGLRNFAWEVLGLGSVTWAVDTWIEFRAWRSHHFQKHKHLILRIVVAQPATLAMPIAGLSVLLGSGGGLYWLIPAVCMSFAGAMLSAWVLLVEILR